MERWNYLDENFHFYAERNERKAKNPNVRMCVSIYRTWGPGLTTWSSECNCNVCVYWEDIPFIDVFGRRHMIVKPYP